jgi:capsule polysaccharide export protein KpsE/RkpR
MVNAIIAQFDKKVQAIHREKYNEVVRIAEKMLVAKKKEIDSVEAKLHELRTQYGIIDYANQTREVARGYLRTVDGDNAAHNINMPEVIKLKKNIEEKGGEFIYYNTRLYDLLGLYSKLQSDYDKAIYDANKNFTHTNVVTAPVVADKKSYPVRWMIVFFSMASTLLLATILIVIIDNRHYFQTKSQ